MNSNSKVHICVFPKTQPQTVDLRPFSSIAEALIAYGYDLERYVNKEHKLVLNGDETHLRKKVTLNTVLKDGDILTLLPVETP